MRSEMLVWYLSIRGSHPLNDDGVPALASSEQIRSVSVLAATRTCCMQSRPRSMTASSQVPPSAQSRKMAARIFLAAMHASSRKSMESLRFALLKLWQRPACADVSRSYSCSQLARSLWKSSVAGWLVVFLVRTDQLTGTALIARQARFGCNWLGDTVHPFTQFGSDRMEKISPPRLCDGFHKERPWQKK